MSDVYNTGSYIKPGTINTIRITPLKKLPLFLENEITYLNEKYKNITTLKRVFTHIRNELKQADLTVKKLNLCLVYYKLNTKQQAWFKKYTARTLTTKREELTIIKDPLVIVKQLTKLLHSQHKIELLIGIAGLTGRRVAEVACTADFKLHDEASLLFSGQLKIKGRIDVKAFIIPCLTPTIDILKAHTKLKKLLGDIDPEKFHNTYSRSISVVYHNHFEKFYDTPHQVKDLRAFYAEYCFLIHQPLVAKTRYFSQILGHDDEDNITGTHYERFRISWHPAHTKNIVF
jgi:hypothetical protein